MAAPQMAGPMARTIILAACLVAVSPLHGVAQDYTNATNAAWCVGALQKKISDMRAGAATKPPNVREVVEAFIAPWERARKRHAAFLYGYGQINPAAIAALLGFV